jgi:DNA-binding transcriptional ArsR family regulator
MENLRDRLETDEEPAPHKKAPRPPPPPTPPIGEDMAEFGRQMGEYGRELGDYIKMVVNDAMRGADKAMRSIFIGPHGAKIKINDSEISLGDAAAAVTKPVPPEKAQQLLSPLASAERIKILYLLAEEPRYHQDLMDKSGLAPGTLPHHLKQLEEAGYVTQERVRGRYLITIPGRMALKLAEYLNYQMKAGSEDELKDKGA